VQKPKTCSPRSARARAGFTRIAKERLPQRLTPALAAEHRLPGQLLNLETRETSKCARRRAPRRRRRRRAGQAAAVALACRNSRSRSSTAAGRRCGCCVPCRRRTCAARRSPVACASSPAPARMAMVRMRACTPPLPAAAPRLPPRCWPPGAGRAPPLMLCAPPFALRRRADLAGLKADLERFRKNESAAQAAAPKQARQPSG